jgi:hypothetical protein
MSRFVIVAYKPKPGKAKQLNEVVAKHLRVLSAEGLVTQRAAYVMRGEGRTLIEVFEWLSAEAIEQAHSNPAVLALWSEFEAVCEYVPLASLTESQHMFAEFEPVVFTPSATF